jgi:Mg2+ and Co2+ transporter CorA
MIRAVTWININGLHRVDIIPELKWRGAYFVIWGVILIVAISMVVFFKRKKWL